MKFGERRREEEVRDATFFNSGREGIRAGRGGAGRSEG